MVYTLYRGGSSGIFQGKLYFFQGSRGGGGRAEGPTFSRVEGSLIANPMGTYRTCYFPEGVRTPLPPPPDPRMYMVRIYVQSIQ